MAITPVVTDVSQRVPFGGSNVSMAPCVVSFHIRASLDDEGNAPDWKNVEDIRWDLDVDGVTLPAQRLTFFDPRPGKGAESLDYLKDKETRTVAAPITVAGNYHGRVWIRDKDGVERSADFFFSVVADQREVRYVSANPGPTQSGSKANPLSVDTMKTQLSSSATRDVRYVCRGGDSLLLQQIVQQSRNCVVESDLADWTGGTGGAVNATFVASARFLTPLGHGNIWRRFRLDPGTQALIQEHPTTGGLQILATTTAINFSGGTGDPGAGTGCWDFVVLGEDAAYTVTNPNTNPPQVSVSAGGRGFGNIVVVDPYTKSILVGNFSTGMYGGAGLVPKGEHIVFAGGVMPQSLSEQVFRILPSDGAGGSGVRTSAAMWGMRLNWGTLAGKDGCRIQDGDDVDMDQCAVYDGSISAGYDAALLRRARITRIYLEAPSDNFACFNLARNIIESTVRNSVVVGDAKSFIAAINAQLATGKPNLGVQGFLFGWNTVEMRGARHIQLTNEYVSAANPDYPVGGGTLFEACLFTGDGNSYADAADGSFLRMESLDPAEIDFRYCRFPVVPAGKKFAVIAPVGGAETEYTDTEFRAALEALTGLASNLEFVNTPHAAAGGLFVPDATAQGGLAVRLAGMPTRDYNGN
ncbi:MAG: hypothetical protein KDA28_12935, partial [Phycisphaerales bacterium]|nr:hypothetical protein [Phycisphaerales bacterium]